MTYDQAVNIVKLAMRQDFPVNVFNQHQEHDSYVVGVRTPERFYSFTSYAQAVTELPSYMEGVR